VGLLHEAGCRPMMLNHKTRNKSC